MLVSWEVCTASSRVEAEGVSVVSADAIWDPRAWLGGEIGVLRWFDASDCFAGQIEDPGHRALTIPGRSRPSSRDAIFTDGSGRKRDLRPEVGHPCVASDLSMTFSMALSFEADFRK